MRYIKKINIYLNLLFFVSFFGNLKAFSFQSYEFFGVIPTYDQLKEIVNNKKNRTPEFQDIPKSNPLIVIGEDKRMRFSDSTFPRKAFGKIRFGENGNVMCSGTLVGPRHVLTNAHCIDANYPMYFFPSYNNGDYLDKTPKTTWVTHMYVGTSTAMSPVNDVYWRSSVFERESDWAILILNENIGNDFGWLDVSPWRNEWLNQPIIYNVSYAVAGPINNYGEYPLFQENCRIREDLGNYYWHDCDTNGGASGSSLVTVVDHKNYIVALHNTGYGNDPCPSFSPGTCSNGAVKTESFIGTLNRALQEYP